MANSASHSCLFDLLVLVMVFGNGKPYRVFRTVRESFVGKTTGGEEADSHVQLPDVKNRLRIRNQWDDK